MASDWTVLLSDMKVPRSLGWADEAMIAMDGIMRPEMSTKKLAEMISQPHSGSTPAWVRTRVGIMASRATSR